MGFVTVPCHFCLHRDESVAQAKMQLKEAWQKREWRASVDPLRLLAWHYSHSAQPKARLIFSIDPSYLAKLGQDEEKPEEKPNLIPLYGCPWCGTSQTDIDLLLNELSKE